MKVISIIIALTASATAYGATWPFAPNRYLRRDLNEYINSTNVELLRARVSALPHSQQKLVYSLNDKDLNIIAQECPRKGWEFLCDL